MSTVLDGTTPDNNIANTGSPPAVQTLGNITTVSGGGGTLIFDLRNTGTTLTVDDIGTFNRVLTAVTVRNGSTPGGTPGGKLEVGNVFAGTLTIGRDSELTADSINVGTLTNNADGTLIVTGDTHAETLNNSGTLTADAAIIVETLNNTNTGNLIADSIDAGILTNSGTLKVDNDVVAETLTNSGTLEIDGELVAKTITNNRTGTLTVDGEIKADTLINNGTTAIEFAGGTIGILGGSGDITSTADLSIGNTAPGGFNGTIDVTGDLTIYQGVFGGDIETTTGGFTADLKGNLSIAGTLSVGGNAEFTGSGHADLNVVKITGSTTIGNNTTVTLDISQSTFGAGGTLDTGATLYAYGEVDDAGLPWSITFSILDGTVISKAIFTDYNAIGTDIVASRRPQAHMNDGYLAALTIHHRYTAWNMVRDRLIADEGRSAWFNYTGRFNTYRSSFNGQNWKTSTHGGQAGVGLFKLPRFQTGLLFGGEGSQSRNDNDKLDATDIYFGVYGAYLFRNGVDTRIVFAQGWQNYDLNRMGNGNVLYTSSFNGYTSEANFELGKRFASGGWSLRPVIAADMYNNNLKAAKETGIGSEAVIYDKTSLTQVFIRTGTDLRHRTKDYTFNSGIYYAYNVNGAELQTRVESVDVPGLSAPLVGTKLGRSLLMFNLGIEGEIDKNFSVFGGYLGECALDSANGAFQSVGYVGFFGKW